MKSFKLTVFYFRYYDTANETSSTSQKSTSAEKTSTSTSTEETVSTSEATIIVKKDEIVLKPIVEPKVRITIALEGRTVRQRFNKYFLVEHSRR